VNPNVLSSSRILVLAVRGRVALREDTASHRNAAPSRVGAGQPNTDIRTSLPERGPSAYSVYFPNLFSGCDPRAEWTQLYQYVASTMVETQPVSNWNPLDSISSEELARLDERFDHALQDTRCLVFWTGLSLELARQWAQPLGLQTLTMTMGPLYSGRGVGSARHGKSSKGWSKYMKGTSGRFAEYGCRNNR